MTRNREPISWKDHNELCDAYAQQFHDREITEDAYRRKLTSLGFTAIEADAEVNTHHPDRKD